MVELKSKPLPQRDQPLETVPLTIDIHHWP